MKATFWIIPGLGLLALGAGCGDDSGSRADDGGTAEDTAGDGRSDVPADVPADVPVDVPADVGPDEEDVPADVPVDVPPDSTDLPADVPTDTPPDGCTVPDPTAHVNGAYAVTTMDVLRPDVFGTVAPSLDTRITGDDIYVVLATDDLTLDATTFALEVGQAQERLYPTPTAQHCTDMLCGSPPNAVTTYSTSVSCNAFQTVALSDLTFSLYPPAHSTSAVLAIEHARVSGTFDAARENISNGLVEGGILEATAAGIFPVSGTSLVQLLTAASIEKDYDRDSDGTMDGWLVEVQFEATYVDFVRP